MTTIDLTPFCDRRPYNGGRIRTHESYVIGGYRYATDTKILARVKCDEADTPPPDKGQYLPADAVIKETWFPLIEAKTLPIIKPIIMEPCNQCAGSGYIVACPECDGEGELRCDLGHDHECEDCNGSGRDARSTVASGKTPVICGKCDGAGNDDDLSETVIDSNRFYNRYLLKIIALKLVFDETPVCIVQGNMLLWQAGSVQGVIMANN